MLLIEPSPKAYLERGRFEQPDRSGKPAWAHPVIANGRLYLRDQDVLLVYDIRKEERSALSGEAAAGLANRPPHGVTPGLVASEMGVASISRRDLTIASVAARNLLKCGVSRCAS